MYSMRSLVSFNDTPVFFIRRIVVIFFFRFGFISRMDPKSPRRMLVALMRSDFKLSFKALMTLLAWTSVLKL